MKRRWPPAWVLLCFLAVACASAPRPEQSQLQVRQFQTREYDALDLKTAMKALMNVLQDDGFILKNVQGDLGMLTAERFVDVENSAEAGLKNAAAWTGCCCTSPFFWRPAPTWEKTAQIECSANVSELSGGRVRIRAVFQKKIYDNTGNMGRTEQVVDEQHYEAFFARLDKSIFLQKQKL